jgi:PqqD family protein of HPr-rel-A system
MTTALRPDGWLLRTWGDEAVLFDTASGDTHYLKPLTLALYQTCREHPGFSASDIFEALAQRLSVAVTPHFSLLADEALTGLRQIGLLETP